MDPAPQAFPGVFATTHWSLVLVAGSGSHPAAQAAWDQLARLSWQPLHQHACRRGRSYAEAADLVQAFFAHLLERSVIARADPARGRFRSFLLGAFDHFLADATDRARAQKRGGGLEHLPWPDEHPTPTASFPVAPSEDPGRQFDRAWAQALLGRTLVTLEAEFSADGKSAQFAALRPYLFASPELGTYATVAAALGIRPALLPKAVARLRARFRTLLRAEIARTVATVREVDDELRYLVELLVEG